MHGRIWKLEEQIAMGVGWAEMGRGFVGVALCIIGQLLRINVFVALVTDGQLGAQGNCNGYEVKYD